MATVTTQDSIGTPLSVGQKCLVRGQITVISGSGATAAITVAAVNGGSLGDTTNTIVVGPKQIGSPTHATGNTQLIYGQYLDAVGRSANVRGTITSISGSGATAAITVTVDNNGNLGDTSNTIVVGPKQIAAVPAQ